MNTKKPIFYAVCPNPECDEVFHEVPPFLAMIPKELTGHIFTASAPIEEMDDNILINWLQNVATAEGLTEIQASKVDDAFQQLNTTSAFDDVPRSGETNEDMASPYGGTAESTGSVTPYEDPYVKLRERELELLAERQAVELRKLNAEALQIELVNQKHIIDYNLKG